jgi:hypothetical protein
MKKRNLFNEMMTGVADMAAQREGKVALHQFEAEELSAPDASRQADTDLARERYKEVDHHEKTKQKSRQ